MPYQPVTSKVLAAYGAGEEQARGEQTRQVTRENMPAALQGDREASARIAQFDPKTAFDADAHFAALQENDYKVHQRGVDLMASTLAPVAEAAPDQFPAMLEQTKAWARAHNVPEELINGVNTQDDVRRALASSLSYKDQLANQLLQREQTRKETDTAADATLKRATAGLYSGGYGKPPQGARWVQGANGQPQLQWAGGSAGDPYYLGDGEPQGQPGAGDGGAPPVAPPGGAPQEQPPVQPVAPPGGRQQTIDPNAAQGAAQGGMAPVARPRDNDRLLNGPAQAIPQPTLDANGNVVAAVDAGSLPYFGRFQRYFEGVADYKLPPPRVSSRNPQSAAQALSAIRQINPDYDANDYDMIRRAKQAFGTGTQGNTARSLSVAVSHLDTLRSLGEALKNGDIRRVNAIKQFWSEQFNGPAPTSFDAAKSIVADEIAKAVIGGQTAQADRDTLAATLRRDSDMESLDGTITSLQRLLGGQLGGLRDQWARTNSGAGREVDPLLFDKVFLSARTRKVLERFAGEENGGGGGGGGGPKEGDRGTSKSGKPTIWHNGKWHFAS